MCIEHHPTSLANLPTFSLSAQLNILRDEEEEEDEEVAMKKNQLTQERE